MIQTLTELKEQAKDMGIKGYHKMKKQELADAILAAGRGCGMENEEKTCELATKDQGVVKMEEEQHWFDVYGPSTELDRPISQVQWMKYGRETTETQDALLHGFECMCGEALFRLLIHENYKDQHVFRVFAPKDLSTLLLFTYIPKGRFGNIPVFDSHIMFIKKTGEEGCVVTYSDQFSLHLPSRKLSKHHDGHTIEHAHSLQDTFVCKDDGRIIGLTSRFCASPFVTRYVVYQGQMYYSSTSGYPYPQQGMRRTFQQITGTENTKAVYTLEANQGGIYWNMCEAALE